MQPPLAPHPVSPLRETAFLLKRGGLGGHRLLGIRESDRQLNFTQKRCDYLDDAIQKRVRIGQQWDYKSFKAGDEFAVDGVKVKVLNAFENGIDENTSSLALRFEYRGFVYTRGAYTTVYQGEVESYLKTVNSRFRETLVTYDVGHIILRIADAGHWTARPRRPSMGLFCRSCGLEEARCRKLATGDRLGGCSSRLGVWEFGSLGVVERGSSRGKHRSGATAKSRLTALLNS